jgi:hypothetical protein
MLNVSFHGFVWQLTERSTDRSASGTAARSPTMSGGSMINSDRSLVDGCCPLFSGRSGDSLELRQSATSGHCHSPFKAGSAPGRPVLSDDNDDHAAPG